MDRNKENNQIPADLQIGLDNIFSVIAHDLRSPFNTILGYCELLSVSIKNGESEKSLKYNKIIQDAASKTLTFLLRLLDWGRLQQGKITFTPEYFPADKQVKEILQFFKFQADAKRIGLKTSIEPGLMVYGDLNMIRTILANLISNAIKFSRSGGKIIIKVRNVKEGTEFTVADNGIGIMPENLDGIFSHDLPFSTLGTGMEQGTGLGLLLCKNFIALHQGRIWAESEYGQGSRFKFTLPSANLA
jgi:two-component system, sensor histidine kinase and response regulator